jgi:hypothetical protein
MTVPAPGIERPSPPTPEVGHPDRDLVQTWTAIDGTRYGAHGDDRGPLGGGSGYSETVTEGNYHVRDRRELVSALEEASAGEVVFVDSAAEIDLTVWVYTEDLVLSIPEGVTLASDRGVGGSAGALLYSEALDTGPLIRATGPEARITGLRLRGPDKSRRTELHTASFGGETPRGRDFYYSFPVSQGITTTAHVLEVDNCELWGWSHAAIYLEAGLEHRIHHNDIHHNQRQGLGYGVHVDDAKATIDRNVFDWNRHSIAGSGVPGAGYAARHNAVLEHANSHLLDMHGGRDRGDGTNVAASWLEYTNNYVANTDHAGIVIRGVPEEEATVSKNWFLHPSADDQAVRSGGRTTVTDNVYGDPPERKPEEYPFESGQATIVR